MEKVSEKHSVTVSIKDIILYLCSRWRILILWLIIGAVLGGAYSGYKSIKAIRAAGTVKQTESVLEDLSESDRAFVQNNTITLIHYLNRYKYYSDYNEKSVFQKLDPETARVGVLTYSVDTEDGRSLSKSFESSFAANITDDTFAEEVANAFGVTREEAFYYYDTVVRVGVDSNNTSVKTDTDDNTVLIQIYGENDEFVTKMMDRVKNSVDRYSSAFSGKSQIKSLKLINETVRKNSDTYIYDKQEEYLNYLKNVPKNITNLKDSLESNILTAVEACLIDQYDGEYIDVAFPGASSEKEEIKPSFHISKKWIVLGAAAGFILAALIILIKYLVVGVVRCYDDIEYTYGIQVLGTYDDPKTESRSHKTRLDKWLKSLRIRRKSQDRESSIDLIAMKLKLLARNLNVKNICIAIGPEVDTDETFIEDVVKKTEDVNVTVASDILRNAGSITKMLEADGVVLLEQMDRSRFSTIDQERVMCAGNNIKILGAIVAE